MVYDHLKYALCFKFDNNLNFSNFVCKPMVTYKLIIIIITRPIFVSNQLPSLHL